MTLVETPYHYYGILSKDQMIIDSCAPRLFCTSREWTQHTATSYKVRPTTTTDLLFSGALTLTPTTKQLFTQFLLGRTTTTATTMANEIESRVGLYGIRSKKYILSLCLTLPLNFFLSFARSIVGNYGVIAVLLLQTIIISSCNNYSACTWSE